MPIRKRLVEPNDSWFTKNSHKSNPVAGKQPKVGLGPHLIGIGLATGSNNAILMVYRPSPCNPCPTRGPYVTCYQVATAELRLYRTMLERRSLDITWLVCHYHFICGVTLLYAYYFSPDVRAHYSTAELGESIDLCSKFLEESTLRWPVFRGIHNAFNTLAPMTLKTFRYETRFSSPVPSFYGNEIFSDFGIQSGMSERKCSRTCSLLSHLRPHVEMTMAQIAMDSPILLDRYLRKPPLEENEFIIDIFVNLHLLVIP